MKQLITFLVLFSSLGNFLFAQTERGQASYYADKFNGRKTASGEVFDNSKFTAAHNSLPFNTMVKVTNIDNGKSVIVKINDRGPFAKNRIIDLTKAAAVELNMLVSGTAEVEVEIIKDDKSKDIAKQAPNAKDLFEVDVNKIQGIGFGIQVYSFHYIDNLFNEILRIEEEYKQKPMVHASIVKGLRVYRLILAPYDNRQQAERKLKKLHKKGKEGLVITLEKLH